MSLIEICFIFLLILFHENLVSSNSCNLPTECQIIKHYEIHNRFPYTIKCSLTESVFDSSSSNISDMNQCDLNKNIGIFLILFYPKNSLSNIILDKRFHFGNLKNYIRQFKNLSIYNVEFNYLHGFEIYVESDSLKYEVILNDYKISQVQFYKSKFDFFIGNKRIETCEDLLIESKFTTNSKTLFQNLQISPSFTFSLKQCDFNRKLCPLIFNNSKIQHLIIDYMVKSFMKTSALSFYELKNNNSTTNFHFITEINRLILNNLENIEINTELLNKEVFEKIAILLLDGNDFRIHPEVFKNFKQLKFVYLLFKKSNLHNSIGAEWMKYLNADVNVSLDEVVLNKMVNGYVIPSAFQIKYRFVALDPRINFKTFFPDEDFCLYVNIPFNQLIVIYHESFFLLPFINEYFYQDIGCTYLWLIQYYPLYIKYYKIDFGEETNNLILQFMRNIETERKLCTFEQRRNNCRLSNYLPTSNPVYGNVDYALNLSYAQMVFIFLTTSICVLGIVSNILVIKTIPLVRKDPELKDRKHYNYMRINAAGNCCLFAIKIVGLINECTAEFWCSAIHREVGVQYYKLIFGELLGTSFRFFSNLTYVAFQICRISLIGKEHGRLVEKVANEMSIKRFVSIVACLSLTLSIVKYFRYKINDFDMFRRSLIVGLEPIDQYPAKFSTIDNFNRGRIKGIEVKAETWALIIINCICDVLNYPLFLIICLIMDVITSRELKITLSNKIVSSNKKAQEEKDEAILKSTRLVKLNAVCNFLLKLPMTIVSILEIVVCLKFYNTSFSYEYVDYFLYLYVDLNGGDFFESLCNFLYFFSLALNCVFFYKFDRGFKKYFRKLFFKDEQ